MDDYSLDAVAREVLGEGKAVAGPASDRLAEILHNYQHDLPAFALYARTDARLALQIVEKLRLVELAFARSQLTGMTPDRVAASIASFDFLYLVRARARAHRRSERARRRLPGARGATGRPRARAGDGPSRQRLGVRFQEPVPEPHPHLQHRSRQLRAGAAAAARSHPHDRGRFSPRAGDLAAAPGRAVPAARGGQAAARRRRGACHQDSDELLLRGARHVRLPLLQPGTRQFHHRDGQASAAVVEGVVRIRRISRVCTATPTACS